MTQYHLRFEEEKSLPNSHGVKLLQNYLERVALLESEDDSGNLTSVPLEQKRSKLLAAHSILDNADINLGKRDRELDYAKIVGIFNVPFPDEYLYNYLDIGGIRGILEEKTWRITPFWKKNDPQESMMVANYDLRIINKSSEVDEKEILESPNNIRTDLDSRINEFRRNLKCAARVRERIPESCRNEFIIESARTYAEDIRSHRGFTRPRMWVQYANACQGACLVFKKSTLTSMFETFCSPNIELIPKPITYYPRNQTLNLGTLNYSFSKKEVSTDALMNSFGESFFKKHDDWKDEVEFRYLLND